MGITTEPFFAMLNSDRVVALKQETLARNSGRKIVVAVDEYDIVKGVQVKLLVRLGVAVVADLR